MHIQLFPPHRPPPGKAECPSLPMGVPDSRPGRSSGSWALRTRSLSQVGFVFQLSSLVLRVRRPWPNDLPKTTGLVSDRGGTRTWSLDSWPMGLSRTQGGLPSVSCGKTPGRGRGCVGPQGHQASLFLSALCSKRLSGFPHVNTRTGGFVHPC